jgi:5-methyltetrahydropteroyltriglutamate--homocysteine methyltransferase
MTVPGPFTMVQQAQNDHYASTEDLAFGYAGRSTKYGICCLGADIVQLDEPYLQARPAPPWRQGDNRALAGDRTTAVHLPGYAAII